MRILVVDDDKCQDGNLPFSQRRRASQCYHETAKAPLAGGALVNSAHSSESSHGVYLNARACPFRFDT